MKNENYICPICGYDGLEEPVYDEIGEASCEICACCGVEFGFDDFDFKNLTFDTVREKWLKDGAEWFDKKAKPKNWNLEEQLKNLQLPEAQRIIEKMTKKYIEIHKSFIEKKKIEN